MKTVLKNSASITHILPRFHYSCKRGRRAKKQRKDDSEGQINGWRKKKELIFLLIFISSPLETVSGEKKTPA